MARRVHPVRVVEYEDERLPRAARAEHALQHPGKTADEGLGSGARYAELSLAQHLKHEGTALMRSGSIAVSSASMRRGPPSSSMIPRQLRRSSRAASQGTVAPCAGQWTS